MQLQWTPFKSLSISTHTSTHSTRALAPHFGAKFTPQELERYEHFRKMRPSTLEPLVCGTLKDPIQAQAVIGFMTIARRKQSVKTSEIPSFVMRLIQKIQTAPAPKPAKPKKLHKEALAELNRLERRYRALAPTSRILVVLTEAGHRITDISNALGIRNGNITVARKRAKLAPTSVSRITAQANEAKKKELQALTQEEIDTLPLPPRIFGDKREIVGSLRALPPLQQHVFRLYQREADRLEKEHVAANSSRVRPPTYSAVRDIVEKELGCSMGINSVRELVDGTREALSSQVPLEERYIAQKAREIRNREKLETLSEQSRFKILPENWTTSPTDEETKKAQRAFKSLKKRPMERVVFVTHCTYPELGTKDKIAILREEGLTLTVRSFNGALTRVRKKLGITTESGKLRVQTKERAAAMSDKLAKALPEAKGILVFNDLNRAKAIWLGQDQKTLSHYDKSIFQAYVLAASECQSNAVSRVALATCYEKLFGEKKDAYTLFARLTPIRKTLGLQKTGLQALREEREQFNRRRQKQALTLPSNWYEARDKNVVIKHGFEALDAATAAFKTLSPIERVIFTLYCELMHRMKPKRAKTTHLIKLLQEEASDPYLKELKEEHIREMMPTILRTLGLKKPLSHKGNRKSNNDHEAHAMPRQVEGNTPRRAQKIPKNVKGNPLL